MRTDAGSGMELRALLAVILSMLVLILYQYLFVPPPVLEPEELAPALPQEAELAPPEPDAEEPLLAAPEGAPLAADRERTLRVRGSEYLATITNVGGRIAGFALPEYSDDFGEPLDLVHPGASALDRLLLQLETPAEPELAGLANAAYFVLEVDGAETDAAEIQVAAGEPVTVTMRWSDGGDWEIAKEVLFPAEGTRLGLRVQARAPRRTPVYVAIGPGLDPVRADSFNYFLDEGAVALRPTGLERWSAGKLNGSLALGSPLRWAGVESHYFLGAFIFRGEGDVRLTAHGVTVPPAQEGQEPENVDLVAAAARVPSQGLDVDLFLGAKHYHRLALLGDDLHRVVDFGWFGFIARPLLYMLVWIHSYVGNYGWAIVLLTALLRVVFLPLNHRAMVSMRKTQRLQPQMAAIRAKYKGVKDLEKRQNMNEEVMELYRREGVSPLGGCLPMLVQLPILFAFYRLLSVAIELRAAPFGLWLQDLSRHDPYYILPVLMGGTMMLQQRMTPTAGMNPAQARIMSLMPILFTALFLSVPSGLVLYWTVNNVLGIAQQLYVNRKVDADEAAAAPAKGKAKGKKRQRGKR